MKRFVLVLLGAFLIAVGSRVWAVDLFAWPEQEKEAGRRFLPGQPVDRRPIWFQPAPAVPAGVTPLTLKDMRLSGKIINNTAQITADFTFHNPTPMRMEGVLMVPLPADVVMTGFVMNSGGKEMKGELLEAYQAQTIYENIVRQMRDPGLLELVGQRMLRARVFPIEPRGQIDVTVTYSQLLNRTGDLHELTLPFTQATGNAKLAPAKVTLDIETTTSIRHLYSPVSGVEITRKGEKRARLTYQGDAAGQPIQIFYGTQEDPLSAGLLAHREAGEKGFFLLSLSPRPVEGASSVAKDIVFVLDRSGSMNQNGKMDQAKEALRFCIKSLNSNDRFSIVTFATGVEMLGETLVAASEGKERALRWVDGIEAAGGTNIEEGLEEGLRLLKNRSDRVPMVFFITDGLPTIGETNFDRLLEKVKERAAERQTRLYVFGVGDDVNTLLLDRMAQENHGARDYVLPGETIENKVSTLYTKVAKPALTDVALDWDGAEVNEVYPRRVNDLFYGEDLVILGRYSKGEKTALTVTGRRGEKKEKYTFNVSLPDRSSENGFIDRLWAHRKVSSELDAIRLGGRADPEVIEGIVRIAKRYGIVTPYTSYLITEDGETMANAVRTAVPQMRRMVDDAREGGRGGEPMRARSAQMESMALSRAEKVMAPSAAGASITMGMGSSFQETKDRMKATGVAVADTREVDGKIFYQRGDTWTDGEYEADPRGEVTEVISLSEDYFKRLRSQPLLAKFFALGKSVIVKWNGVVYKVHP